MNIDSCRFVDWTYVILVNCLWIFTSFLSYALFDLSKCVRSVKPFLTINTLKMIYYSYFHSVMTYGLLFWRNSPDSSIKIFRLQKKIIRIMAGCRYRDSCRKLFINLEIFFTSLSIHSFPSYVHDKKQESILGKFWDTSY